MGLLLIEFRLRAAYAQTTDPFSLEGSFDGDERTRGNVSSIDVRDGSIGLPDEVVSQYRLF